jgi:hypothetical protein
MSRGLNTLGRGFDISWLRGQNTMGREFDVPWMGLNIPWIWSSGGSIYHGKKVHNTRIGGSIYHEKGVQHTMEGGYIYHG